MTNALEHRLIVSKKQLGDLLAKLSDIEKSEDGKTGFTSKEAAKALALLTTSSYANADDLGISVPLVSSGVSMTAKSLETFVSKLRDISDDTRAEDQTMCQYETIAHFWSNIPIHSWEDLLRNPSLTRFVDVDCKTIGYKIGLKVNEDGDTVSVSSHRVGTVTEERQFKVFL